MEKSVCNHLGGQKIGGEGVELEGTLAAAAAKRRGMLAKMAAGGRREITTSGGYSSREGRGVRDEPLSGGFWFETRRNF
jgi:hypothetical protein